MRFIPNDEIIRKAMLAELGLTGIDALFESLPPEVKLDRPLDIPDGMAEETQMALFRDMAATNQGRDILSFLGAGSYPHFSPLVVDHLIQRCEFLTAYTPYQPEISQGTLQAVFEFQSFITYLTGMEIANASMYDGASATAEAVLMADRLVEGRNRVLLSQGLHPHYRQVIDTHTRFLPLTLETAPLATASGQTDPRILEDLLDGQVACVVIQQPNVLGVIEDLAPLIEAIHASGALAVVTVNEPLSLGLLESPGAAGADIVAGEGQGFGIPTAFGGPYLGFMATRDKFKRQIPGRIAGETVDEEGQRGYVLTLATREQHIRREKATSNICTNQNLVMVAALIYLTLMGRNGLLQVARHNVSLLAYFLDTLKGVPGYGVAYGSPSFNEVTVKCPRPAREIVARCVERGIVPGHDLGTWSPDWSDHLLVAVTVTKDRQAIDALVEALGEVTA